MITQINEGLSGLTDPLAAFQPIDEALTYANPPSKCDVCKAKIGKTFYDASLRGMGWGNVCPSCFKMHGKGLGVGLGQKYNKNEEGKYEKEVQQEPKKKLSAKLTEEIEDVDLEVAPINIYQLDGGKDIKNGIVKMAHELYKKFYDDAYIFKLLHANFPKFMPNQEYLSAILKGATRIHLDSSHNKTEQTHE